MVNIDISWPRLKQLRNELNKNFSYFVLHNSRTAVVLFDSERTYFTVLINGSEDHADFVNNFQSGSTEEIVQGIP